MEDEASPVDHKKSPPFSDGVAVNVTVSPSHMDGVLMLKVGAVASDKTSTVLITGSVHPP